MPDKLRIALIGTGRRSYEVYGPLLTMLHADVELAAVWSRSEANAKKFGSEYKISWFTDLEKMDREIRPDAAVVSVGYHANGRIGSRVTELGMHALLETPIAHDLNEADAIIRNATHRNLKVEVAEQYYRYPVERLKKKLINAGAFGRIVTAHNDYMAHGYHGVSLIRNYIGLDQPVDFVNGSTMQSDTAPHYGWIRDAYGPRTENWEHATLHFQDGRLGHFHWTHIGYDSPLRQQRSTVFFGEKGMAVGEKMTVLSDDGTSPQMLGIHWRFHHVDGVKTLKSMHVDLNGGSVEYLNPFQCLPLDDDKIAVADCIMSLVRSIRENADPEYGMRQARLDQEVTLAYLRSAGMKGKAVCLPIDPDE